MPVLSQPFNPKSVEARLNTTSVDANIAVQTDMVRLSGILSKAEINGHLNRAASHGNGIVTSEIQPLHPVVRAATEFSNKLITGNEAMATFNSHMPQIDAALRNGYDDMTKSGLMDAARAISDFTSNVRYQQYKRLLAAEPAQTVSDVRELLGTLHSYLASAAFAPLFAAEPKKYTGSEKMRLQKLKDTMLSPIQAVLEGNVELSQAQRMALIRFTRHAHDMASDLRCCLTHCNAEGMPINQQIVSTVIEAIDRFPEHMRSFLPATAHMHESPIL